jgi:hypothetical protein
VEGRVKGHGWSCRLQLPDGVAAVDHVLAVLWHPQHQVLTCLVVEIAETRGGEDQPVQVGRKRSGIDDLEVPEGGVGQRPARAAHKVQ